MRIDHDEFLAVARVVIKHNKYLAGVEPEWLVERMKDNAYGELSKPGYCSTRGYVLTLFDHPCGGFGCKASISASIFT